MNDAFYSDISGRNLTLAGAHTQTKTKRSARSQTLWLMCPMSVHSKLSLNLHNISDAYPHRIEEQWNYFTYIKSRQYFHLPACGIFPVCLMQQRVPPPAPPSPCKSRFSQSASFTKTARTPARSPRHKHTKESTSVHRLAALCLHTTVVSDEPRGRRNHNVYQHMEIQSRPSTQRTQAAELVQSVFTKWLLCFAAVTNKHSYLFPKNKKTHVVSGQLFIHLTQANVNTGIMIVIGWK